MSDDPNEIKALRVRLAVAEALLAKQKARNERLVDRIQYLDNDRDEWRKCAGRISIIATQHRDKLIQAEQMMQTMNERLSENNQTVLRLLAAEKVQPT